MTRAPAIIGLLLLVLPAALTAQAAPVPVALSMTDDWTAAAHYLRDPSIVNYRGKLYLFWESDDPSGAWPGYHGNLYYRTYEDSGGVFSLGEVSNALTPTVSPFGGEHRNEKAFPIVFDDRLFVVWNSADKATVPDGNVGWNEIIIRGFDGHSWSAPFQVNAPIEPYNMSRRGCNQFVTAAVFGGGLYVAWERNLQYSDNGTALFYSEIWMRRYDGESWSSPIRVSQASQRDYNEGPALGVYDGKLYVAWEQVEFRDPEAWSWKLLVRSFDGGLLGAIGIVASSTDSGYKDSAPRMLGFDNPYSGRSELYIFWRVMGVAQGESALRAAIGYSVFDGASWSPQGTAAPITSSALTATGLGRMSACVFEDRIYIAWATSNENIKSGEDYDIALRSFDGLGWGPITEATAAGDENLPQPSQGANPSGLVELTPEGLPLGFSPLSDFRPERIWFDNDPRMVEYKHRLYVTWRTQPDFRYYGWMTITLKVVEDFDADGDGVFDTADVFPEDPANSVDTDGDGVGDTTDPAPYDPDIWLSGQKAGAAAPANPVAPLALLLVGCAAAAYLLRPSGKGSRATDGEGN
jgi:hypothetical protein